MSLQVPRAQNVFKLFFFFSTIIPKTKDIQSNIVPDKDNQKILTSEKPEPENVWQFCLENYLSIKSISISKLLSVNFLAIDYSFNSCFLRICSLLYL